MNEGIHRQLFFLIYRLLIHFYKSVTLQLIFFNYQFKSRESPLFYINAAVSSIEHFYN